MADDTSDNGRFTTNNPDDTNPLEDMKRDEQLPEDNTTPAAPPDDVDDELGNTAPPTDTNMDEHEQYDAGTEAAAGVELPDEGDDDEEDAERIA